MESIESIEWIKSIESIESMELTLALHGVSIQLSASWWINEDTRSPDSLAKAVEPEKLLRRLGDGGHRALMVIHG